MYGRDYRASGRQSCLDMISDQLVAAGGFSHHRFNVPHRIAASVDEVKSSNCHKATNALFCAALCCSIQLSSSIQIYIVYRLLHILYCTYVRMYVCVYAIQKLSFIIFRSRLHLTLIVFIIFCYFFLFCDFFEVFGKSFHNYQRAM